MLSASRTFCAAFLCLTLIAIGDEVGRDPVQPPAETLHNACESGSLDTVKFLIQNGTDPNTEWLGYENRLPLHSAVSRGHIEIVRFLVKSGARLNDTQPTALEAAVRSLEKDATDLDQARSATKDAAPYAMLNELLLLGADIHAQNECALAAATWTQLPIVKHLIELGATPNHSTLVAAVRAKNLDIFDYLISKGLDPMAKGEQGKTLLHEAADFKIWYYTPLDLVGARAVWDRLIQLGLLLESKDDQGHTPLHTAAAAAHLAMVEWLLEHKANANAETSSGVTPLMLVAQCQDESAFALVAPLAKAGARLDSQDKSRRNALDFASETNAWAVVTELLAAGATPTHAISILERFVKVTQHEPMHANQTTIIVKSLLPHVQAKEELKLDGMPLLSWAVLMGDEVLVQAILKAGTDVNARDSRQRTALMLACLTGGSAIGQLLRNAGADTTLTDLLGDTADALASRHFLAMKNSPDGNSDESSYPTSDLVSDDLFDAISHHRIADMKRLAIKGSKALTEIRHGIQPLHLAVALSQRDTVQILLSNGASILSKTIGGEYCTTIAIESASVEFTRWLLSLGDANQHRVLLDQLKPGSDLWQRGLDGKLLQLLTQEGWKPKDDEEGNRALLWVIENNDLETMNRLLASGVELKPRSSNSKSKVLLDVSHRSSLEAAAKLPDTLILKNLLSRLSKQRAAWNVDITLALIAACNAGSIPAVKVLIEEARADVNAKSVEFDDDLNQLLPVSKEPPMAYTAISYAVEADHLEIVEYLLSKGAKLAGRDRAQRQALASAVTTGDLHLVQLLLKHGAELEAKDAEGRTALHEAVSRGFTEIAQLLIAKGANPLAKDKEGQTAADLAKKSGSKLQ